MNGDDNPMHPFAPGLAQAAAAPRCHARSKRTGEPCQAPAVTGWRVCRVHGAGGGHRAGSSHPSWRHGMRARAWLEERARLAELVRETRDFARMLEEWTEVDA